MIQAIFFPMPRSSIFQIKILISQNLILDLSLDTELVASKKGYYSLTLVP